MLLLFLLFCWRSHIIRNRSKTQLTTYIIFKTLYWGLRCACHFARRWRYCDKANDEDSCSQGDTSTCPNTGVGQILQQEKHRLPKISQDGLLISLWHQQKLLGCTPSYVQLEGSVLTQYLAQGLGQGSAKDTWIWSIFEVLKIWDARKPFDGTVLPFLKGAYMSSGQHATESSKLNGDNWKEDPYLILLADA